MKTNQSKLLEMQDISYSIFDDMLEGIQVIDQNWKYVYLNKAAIAHGKSTQKELIGKSMLEMYPGIENTEMFSKLKECMENQNGRKMINHFMFPDGTEGYFDLRFSPVPHGVLIMSVDITAQKRLEAELIRINESLEQTVFNRTQELSEALEREKKLNEIKSRFVYITSHEFKTPLGAIEISTNVLETLNSPDYSKERDKYHGYIKTSVKSLYDIVHDFLSVEKMEQDNFHFKNEKINLKLLVKEEIGKIVFTCKQDQSIKYRHKGNVKIYADISIIRSILSNLISNAIKYSQKDVLVKTEITDEFFSIHIKDRGIGIPLKEQNKLYEKFFRASNVDQVHGTGLGLNIVKKYVDLMGGSIECISQKNIGTEFTVKLPKI